MINIVNASCKVAELPQRLLRRVAVSLSQNETILLRVLLAAEGVPGPFRPQEDVDEKASDPAKKRIAKRRVPASCALRHSADHSKARATDGAARSRNDRCGWPADACDEPRSGQP